jgi:hypothetical protein
VNPAMELIQRIEAAGGRFAVEGEELVIRPGDPAMPLVAELRLHKAEIIDLIRSRSATPAETPEDDLLPGAWLLERCAYRDHCWGGIGALYLDLARWCAEHGRPAPESRQAFRAELQTQGFAVTTDGLVYGLMLAEDWQAHERFQAAPEASELPAQPNAAKRRIAGRRRA